MKKTSTFQVELAYVPLTIEGPAAVKFLEWSRKRHPEWYLINGMYEADAQIFQCLVPIVNMGTVRKWLAQNNVEEERDG